MRTCIAARTGLLTAVLAFVAGASGPAAVPRTPTSTGTVGFPTPTLTPTYGGPGVTTCGSWSLRATTPRGTFPLLSCAATAGLRKVPSVRVEVGDEVLISAAGGAPISLALEPADLVGRAGPLFVARAAGRTTVSTTGWYCNPVRPGGSRPRSCPLLRIIAS